MLPSLASTATQLENAARSIPLRAARAPCARPRPPHSRSAPQGHKPRLRPVSDDRRRPRAPAEKRDGSRARAPGLRADQSPPMEEFRSSRPELRLRSAAWLCTGSELRPDDRASGSPDDCGQRPPASFLRPRDRRRGRFPRRPRVVLLRSAPVSPHVTRLAAPPPLR